MDIGRQVELDAGKLLCREQEKIDAGPGHGQTSPDESIPCYRCQGILSDVLARQAYETLNVENYFRLDLYFSQACLRSVIL